MTLPTALLSDEFLATYAERSPAWGPIGEVVYLRTYSRWIEAEGRRERWHETVARVVEHSMTLEPGHLRSSVQRRQEAEELFDAIWNLRAFPSGRGLWVAGTDHARNNAMAMFNCAYTNIHTTHDFYDMVILLMNGAGVGFGVREDQVAEFRKQGTFTARAAVGIAPYTYAGTPGMAEHTMRIGDALIVGDSREGWAEFVRDFLNAYLFSDVPQITVNVDYVRPKGSVLRTFGGFASGPEPLIEFVRGVERVCAGQTEITSVMLLDIANLIGRMVVAGGTRRSAQIGLGSAYDTPYSNAKTGDWWKDFGWRSQSNNSVVFYDKPSAEQLTAMFEQVIEYGEPGFINGAAALKRRSDWAGLNPCAR